MNAKKERELLVVGLERRLRKESKIVEKYTALAEMLEGILAGLLLDWVVIEEEAHHTLLINIIHSLKQTAPKGSENGADGVETERETMLYSVQRLRTKEQAVVAACHSLNSQALSRETKSQFLPILNRESVEFVGLMPVNEIINQRHHNAASHNVA